MQVNEERWPLLPGDKIRRSELHDRFGGSRQGGISPSARSKNVFLFSDASTGSVHGYADVWKDDSTFLYTGEGQYGDQVMRAGNLQILRHRVDGRALRLFEGSGGIVTYVCELEIDDAEPFEMIDAPEKH